MQELIVTTTQIRPKSFTEDDDFFEVATIRGVGGHGMRVFVAPARREPEEGNVWRHTYYVQDDYETGPYESLKRFVENDQDAWVFSGRNDVLVMSSAIRFATEQMIAEVAREFRGE